MRNRKRVELLAPAGNPEAFYGAVNAGADAVYLAGSRFGARAYADNFTTEELVECIRYGHLLGRKIYLTVNTLVKEQELDDLYEYILPFYEAGLDAVIVQDFGVFRYLKRHFPDMELHASTQMTLCGSYGAELLKDMGATRIVPARELGLEELQTIKNTVDIELETFIHGAMCYCYSGQCLFSSILGGRSGNRGRCAQPCRLPYAVKTEGKRGKEAYYLSLKDMCTLEHIPELLEAGIDSFKIEGRMKKPEYAAGVTAIYRRYIDRYYELLEKHGAETARERFRIEQKDKEALESLYIRSEIQDGYYFKHNGREMVTLSSPAYSGSDDRQVEEIRRRYLSGRRKLPVAMNAVFRENEKALLCLSHGDISVVVEGEAVQTATRQPITEENIRKQLGKLGDSSFCEEQMEISVSGSAFYPLKQINEMRRQAVFALEEAILEAAGYQKRQPAEAEPEEILPEQETGGFAVSVETMEQLETVREWINEHEEAAPDVIYVSGDLLVGTKEGTNVCEELSKVTSVFVALPYILRASDKAYLEQLYALTVESTVFSGFLVRSADGLGFLRSRKKQGLLHLNANVYTWNREAVRQLSTEADSFCIPYELKTGEQRQLLKSGGSFEKIVYGRIPMMVTANCVLRTSDKCRKNSSTQSVLTDRYEKEFPVVRNCLHCMNIIYNSVPLSLHQEVSKWSGRVRLRIDLTVEAAGETRKLLDGFLAGKPFTPAQYTTGHEKRGVE